MIATSRRVEDLENFGKPLLEFPKQAQRKQGKIFLRQLRARYGTFGVVRVLAEVMAERRRLRQRYADEFRRYETEIGPGVVKETQMLVSMFNVIAEREGRNNAYPVIRDMMNEVAPHSMRALYQVDELVECDVAGCFELDALLIEFDGQLHLHQAEVIEHGAIDPGIDSLLQLRKVFYLDFKEFIRV